MLNNSYFFITAAAFAIIGIAFLAIFITVITLIIKSAKNGGISLGGVQGVTDSDSSRLMHESFMRDHTTAHNNAIHAHHTAVDMHNSAVNMHNHMMHM
jgi:hypothetical protein